MSATDIQWESISCHKLLIERDNYVRIRKPNLCSLAREMFKIIMR